MPLWVGRSSGDNANCGEAGADIGSREVPIAASSVDIRSSYPVTVPPEAPYLSLSDSDSDGKPGSVEPCGCLPYAAPACDELRLGKSTLEGCEENGFEMLLFLLAEEWFRFTSDEAGLE